MELLIKIKNYGKVKIKLFPELAPIAINSIKRLAEKGRYNNRRIERLEPDFVIQPLFVDGLDPEMDQMIDPEFKTNLANHAYPFERGVVAMAGDEEHASCSQFFICLKEKEYLNGNFTVIGRVIDGWEEIERLENLEVDAFPYEVSGRTFHVPHDDQIVESVTVTDAVKHVAIVSLSAGTIGEDFVKHEVDLGLKRLQEYGLKVSMMPHAMKGIDFVKNHPEKRAQDLLQALADDSIDMILCAIGGDDTYRLLPHLFEHDELRKTAKKKIFLGFSDTTMNHLMLHKIGLNTFYGQSFLADICELDQEMLPYTAKYFEELITTGKIKEITPSSVWYEERNDWSEASLATPRVSHSNDGFQLLQGSAEFCGEILGGCIETLYDFFDNTRHADSIFLTQKYHLFPDLDDWRGKILLLESSEETSSPEHYREMLNAIKKTGIFNVISGIICGKPMDEIYFEEYKRIIKEVVANPNLPIVANVNIGHATPRCIIPFGIPAKVNVLEQKIHFEC